MHVLVTGAAGFIGSNFVRHVLASSDDHVTAFDALTYAGNRANLAEFEPDARFRFVHGDVTDRLAVRSAVAGHHAVVHLAAESHVDRSLLDPDVFVRTNCTGTNVVCDEARRAGVERFLHVSTDEVYGSIDVGAFTEDGALRPSSPYSASKAGSDLIALSHHTSNGLPVVVTRSSNQFGPHQFPEKLIPFFVTTLLQGGTVPLYGDGLNVRDWLFVEDNCAALDLVLRTGAVGEVYNVGGHNERTNRQVTEAVLACLGLDGSRVEHVADRPGHDRRYAVATEKVEALGHRRTRDFEDALEATVAWYVDHPAWWQPLVERVRNR
ncbi:dTDP-glucose 4,6-dehydratase [Aquihabitans sp. G128]|uniref:dTDP-glucose 4,6-dehydratase n=1 Tax=Aquihabitans sp. G128 TaxID=2849779 RepID=UPI001C231E40|nr:dTDP-glucose 4,6-dehydratase [Aquihabitans sp. G128]QXC61480.1 dTDP-glucose 4,6-dehydratase [Aquihabitans sp. G128]